MNRNTMPLFGDTLSGPFLVDAHVHFYHCYDLLAFLNHADQNFKAAARILDLVDLPLGWLLFATSKSEGRFPLFEDRECGRRSIPDWSFAKTCEAHSIVASHRGRPRLVLVEGRQIVTAEGLEILALGSTISDIDGSPVRTVLATLCESTLVTVLPWGVGKWWFQRGRLLADILDRASPRRLYLGDISGRPRVFRRPNLFAAAQAKGMFVLPGTDPLPFSGQVSKPGSFGFVISGKVLRDYPFLSLISILEQQKQQPASYGYNERLHRFVPIQAAMQMRKVLGRAKPAHGRSGS